MALAKDEEFKRALSIDAETWQMVRDYARNIPLLKLMAIEGALQSPLPSMATDKVTTCHFNNRMYKRYELSGLLQN
jgi:hypothetical protein